MDQSDSDLESAIDELSATLRDLRDEVGRQRGSRRRPPTPREILRLAERRAIPTAIAVLEANIRALELFADVIRLAEGRGPEGALPERAREASRLTLDRLDGALADLQTAVEGGEPTNPEARRLLRQARDLREEISTRVGEGHGKGVSATGPTTIPVGSEDDVQTEEVDVESELDTIRDEVDGERDDEEP